MAGPLKGRTEWVWKAKPVRSRHSAQTRRWRSTAATGPTALTCFCRRSAASFPINSPCRSPMWAYRSGEDSEQLIMLLDYQPGRGQQCPQIFLGDYRSILMSDGYSAWRTLKGVTHAGCMAHARRRFVDALKAGKKPAGRRRRPSSSSANSTALKGRCETKSRMTAKRRPTTCTAFVSNAAPRF